MEPFDATQTEMEERRKDLIQQIVSLSAGAGTESNRFYENYRRAAEDRVKGKVDELWASAFYPMSKQAGAFVASGKSRFDIEKFCAIDTTAEVIYESTSEVKGLILPPESE